jgi:hypothetical protein
MLQKVYKRLSSMISMELGIKEKVGRWILLGEDYLENNIPIVIKDIEDNWFFGNITLIQDNYITIYCTGPEHRKGKTETIEWLRVKSFERMEVRD